MKKIIILAVLSISALMADYTTFDTRTIQYSGGVEKEVFFGTLSDYNQATMEIAKSIQAHGTLGAINGLGVSAQALSRGFYSSGMKAISSGAVIGVVIGFSYPYLMQFYADQEYVLIKAVKLKNGKSALRAITFIGNKHPSLSESQIHTILQGK